MIMDQIRPFGITVWLLPSQSQYSVEDDADDDEADDDVSDNDHALAFLYGSSDNKEEKNRFVQQQYQLWGEANDNKTIKDREQHTQSAQYSASASSSYDTLCNTKMGFDWNKIQCLNGDEKTAFIEMELFRDHNWRI